MSAPVVLVLASGKGERFKASGGKGSKLDALLGGISVLERTKAAVRASGLPFHVEDAGHPGMGDSISAAVSAHADAPAWLVLPADLPLVTPESLRAVAAAVRDDNVVVPTHGGAKGHPVAFGRAYGPALRLLSGGQGGSPIVRAAAESGRVKQLELSDPGIMMDIDTLDDLAAAEKLLSARSA